MTIKLRARPSISWLDPQGRWALASVFRERLMKRMQGQKGVFVTLTYDPQRNPTGRDLYRLQRDEQHVPLFLRRLSRRLGVSLKGQWVRKMEFQQNGNVHFHLIILGRRWIDHKILAEAWGHGFVHVKSLTRSHVDYLAKYVAKGGDVPPWLFGEPIRSVKIISASPGFWGDTEPEERDDPPEKLTVSAYRTVGESIRRAHMQSIVHDESSGRFDLIELDVGWALSRLHKAGLAPTTVERGWYTFDCSADFFWRAINRGVEREGPEAGGDAQRRPGSGLHLISAGNPDAVLVPGWLVELLRSTGAIEEVAA